MMMSRHSLTLSLQPPARLASPPTRGRQATAVVCAADGLEPVRRSLAVATTRLVNGAFRLMSAAARGVSCLQPREVREAVHVVRDIRYADGSEGMLDLSAPSTRGTEPLTTIMYLHGGSFCGLSRRTHWMMGEELARRGYLVANVDYRLAPQDPFPAGLQDASAALQWAYNHIGSYNGHPARIVLAGDSAGGNLAAAVAFMCCFERPEDYAQQLFAQQRVPLAVVCVSGMMQVETSAAQVPWLIDAIMGLYRGGSTDRELASPLYLLQSNAVPARPLPPFYVAAGGSDPLAPESHALADAYHHGPVCSLKIYAGGMHAFPTLAHTAVAQQFFDDVDQFIRYVEGR